MAGLAAGEELLGLIAAQTPSAETSTREMLRRLRSNARADRTRILECGLLR